jgi:hypothetical protein
MSSLLSAIQNRRFKFNKRTQLFVRVHNVTLPVAAMCVSNPDCSPARIHGCDAAPTSTAFLEIVGDYFPILHRRALRITVCAVFSLQVWDGLGQAGAAQSAWLAPVWPAVAFVCCEGAHEAQSCSAGLTSVWAFLPEPLRYCLAPAVVAQLSPACSVLPLHLVDAGPPPRAFESPRN